MLKQPSLQALRDFERDFGECLRPLVPGTGLWQLALPTLPSSREALPMRNLAGATGWEIGRR